MMRPRPEAPRAGPSIGPIAPWLLIGLWALPAVALADAESSNTLSLTLNFTPAVNNVFGYSDLAHYQVNGLSAPGAGTLTSLPNVASLTLAAPQDVVSVSPDNSDSKTTAASLLFVLENVTGSGGSSLSARPYSPMIKGSFSYVLDDSLVDNPPLDSAASAYFVDIFVNGALAFTDTLSATSPDKLSKTVNFDLSNIVLPANSVTTLIAQLGLSAEAASSRPPAPAFPQLPPPPEPSYAPTPEPSEWAMMALGLGAVGALLRSRRRRPRALA